MTSFVGQKWSCLFYGRETDTGSWIGFEERFAALERTSLVTIPGGHIPAAFYWSSLKPHIEKFLKD